MPTKEQLLKPETFNLKFFKKEGFQRQKCASCKNNFWSLTKRKTCGDQPCGEYEFIGKPFIPKHYDWKQLRSKFLEFFEDRGHQAVGRYPIVSRWKPDTFYVGASIYDFMPWVLNGSTEPPANPLAISQPSFRAQDLDNIGLGTGRHMSTFEMMAHHVFNYKKEIYWKEETVKYCFEWTKHLGIDSDYVIFKENWWEGGGNAGPCFEVIVKGNEIATLVFMEYKGPNNGNYEKMQMRVVDTGYGLERHVWGSHGTRTIYDAIYPEIIEWLSKKANYKPNKEILDEFCRQCGRLNIDEVNVILAREKLFNSISKKMGVKKEEIVKVINPLHNIYQIADHTRAIMFILNDGVVPSNVYEGYIARLLIRRAVRSLADLGVNVPLSEIVSMQINSHKEVYPEFEDNSKDILKMVDVEQEKYRETLKRGIDVVKKIAKGKEKLTEKELIMLYDSHGLLPRDVRRIEPCLQIDLSDVETKIAVKKTSAEVREEKKPIANIPQTKILFYDKERDYRFKAKVLKVDDDKVILDQTLFYPRGGGQEPDNGMIGGGRVYDVEQYGTVVVHSVENPKLKVGDTVDCEIDEERREQIRKHHTATHLVNGAARETLGRHVWQSGSKKDIDKAHLDATHYMTLTDDEVAVIEKRANELVKKNLKVTKSWMERSAAEKKYGHKLYQGGVAPGKMLRIVDIGGFDVEACGGMHCDSSKEVGEIVIIKAERPQDGIVRFIYASDKAAQRYLQEQGRIFDEIKNLLGSRDENIVPALRELTEEWKLKQKELEGFRSKAAGKIAENIKFEERNGLKFLLREVEHADIKKLQEVSRQLSNENTVIILVGKNGKLSLFTSCGTNAIKKGYRAGNIVKNITKFVGGLGGGMPNVGQGVVADISKLGKILEVAKKELKR